MLNDYFDLFAEIDKQLKKDYPVYHDDKFNCCGNRIAQGHSPTCLKAPNDHWERSYTLSGEPTWKEKQ
jgi:hypothetical protein